MPLESDEDRAALLDPDEAAVVVTVTPAAGAPREFSALVDAQAFVAELSDGLRATTAAPQLFGLETDLAAVLEDDAITIADPLFPDTYQRGDPALPDGTGFATLSLSRVFP